MDKETLEAESTEVLEQRLAKALETLEGQDEPDPATEAEARDLAKALAKKYAKGDADEQADDEGEGEDKPAKPAAKPGGKKSTVSDDLKALLGDLNDGEDPTSDEEDEDEDEQDDESEGEAPAPGRKPAMKKGITPEEDSDIMDDIDLTEEGLEGGMLEDTTDGLAEDPEAEELLDGLEKALGARTDEKISKALETTDTAIGELRELVEQQGNLIKAMSEALVNSGRIPASAVAPYQALEKGAAGAAPAAAEFQRDEAESIMRKGMQAGMCSAVDAVTVDNAYRDGEPQIADALVRSTKAKLGE